MLRRVGRRRAHGVRLLARELAQVEKRGGAPHVAARANARRGAPVASRGGRARDGHGGHGDDRREPSRRHRRRRRCHQKKHQAEAQRRAVLRRQAGHRQREPPPRDAGRRRVDRPRGHHGGRPRRAPRVEDVTGGVARTRLAHQARRGTTGVQLSPVGTGVHGTVLCGSHVAGLWRRGLSRGAGVVRGAAAEVREQGIDVLMGASLT
mmetsp:Transcript_13142/g.55508  ORF Transcript_13142/g.55508 Transcript_13142/m.55508 type:complete len:207 (+) Transcript_13142:494-1114(+)